MKKVHMLVMNYINFLAIAEIFHNFVPEINKQIKIWQRINRPIR